MMSLVKMQKTINNPVIPYTGTVLGGLQPLELVVVRGFVPEDSDRFQVDFQCGNSVKPRADVAFHFNPRFKRSGCVVCNTLQQERWGSEEITYAMPFEKGKSFEIVFMVLLDKFQVAVNGKHLLLYKHRIDLERIDTLGIYGKVQVQMIGFVANNDKVPGGSQFIHTFLVIKRMVPSDPHNFGFVLMDCVEPRRSNAIKANKHGLPISEIQADKYLNPSDVQLQVVPYVARLNSAVEPGQTLVIKGEVNENPSSFSINLKPSDSSDIALHLNPRMKTKVFVRNSYLHDSWGEEERSISHFPFSPGMYFELIIFCDALQYKVAVNGVHTLEYKHRFKHLDKINILEICGDIRLLDVRSW